MNGTPPLIAGSLFSGHGQLDFGLHLAGIKHAWFCESDPWRRGILEKRWPGIPVFDDVRAVDGAAPRVDLLVGGFPCRGGSSAGKREGMDHPETALWREMARILGELRPRLCLLENVANLLAVRGGGAWGEVLGDLASLGYVCGWDCLPAAAFGAPHLRDRVFAVAALANADGSDELGHGGLGGEQDRRADAGGGAAPDAHRNALREQPERQRGEPSEAELGISACGCSWEWVDHGGFCACCHAHLDDPEASTQNRETEATDPASDADEIRREADPQHDLKPQGGEPAPLGDHPDGLRLRAEWGQYAGAIQRWEEVAWPAPQPLVRGLDARDARRLVRSQLSAYGDGVHLGPAVFLGCRLRELFLHLQAGGGGS